MSDQIHIKYHLRCRKVANEVLGSNLYGSNTGGGFRTVKNGKYTEWPNAALELLEELAKLRTMRTELAAAVKDETPSDERKEERMTLDEPIELLSDQSEDRQNFRDYTDDQNSDDELLAFLRELQAARETLAKLREAGLVTADGKYIVDATDLWWWDGNVLLQGVGAAIPTCRFVDPNDKHMQFEPNCGITGCYSTREAAALARAGEEKKDA